MSAKGTTSTGSSWWSAFVTAAQAKLSALVASAEAEAIKIFDAVEPVAVELFGEGISELEQLAINALTSDGIGLLTGQEKLSEAVKNVTYAVETTGKQAIITDVQQAVSNASDALGIAKANMTPATTEAAAPAAPEPAAE